MSSEVHYLPLTPGLFSILVFLFVGLIILIQLRIVRYAYMRLGVGPGVALVLLFGSLIGSYFNIPITVLSGPPVRSGQVVEFFGMRYIVPFVTSSGTVLAVNVGGAVIPTLMSAYLMIRYQFWLKATIATAAIAVVMHSLATPVPGIGIAVPVLALRSPRSAARGPSTAFFSPAFLPFCSQVSPHHRSHDRRGKSLERRDDFSSNHPPALSFCLSMIFSKN